MRYSYKCPRCGWTGERLAKVAERDNQTCDEMTETDEWEDYELVDEDGNWDSCKVYETCGAKLEREEIALTAKMPNQWGQWRGGG